MKNFIQRFKKTNTKRLSPEEKSRLVFEKKAKEQFMRLKEKGLSISVFTL